MQLCQYVCEAVINENEDSNKTKEVSDSSEHNGKCIFS